MKFFLSLIILLVILFCGFYIFTIRNINVVQNNKQQQKDIANTTNYASATPRIESASPKEYSVPIFMYHYVRDYNNPKDKIGTNLSVSPENFNLQLKWLQDNGYKTVDLNYLINPSVVSFKPVILTFDDGYSDAYTNAFTILRKYNFTGTFYLITNKVSIDSNYLTWEQIIKMKNDGMIFGSHTMSHPDLSKISDEKTRNEIFQSKQIIENKLNTKIYDFCYPSGKYNTKSIDILKQFGYNTATTTKSGIANQNSNIYELPRTRVTNNIDLEKILK